MTSSDPASDPHGRHGARSHGGHAGGKSRLGVRLVPELSEQEGGDVRQVDQDIIEACRAALGGQPFIYPNALSALMRRYLTSADHGQDAAAGLLTPRETEVVKLIAEGHSSQEIADTMCISLKAVDRHRTTCWASST